MYVIASVTVRGRRSKQRSLSTILCQAIILSGALSTCGTLNPKMGQYFNIIVMKIYPR